MVFYLICISNLYIIKSIFMSPGLIACETDKPESLSSLICFPSAKILFLLCLVYLNFDLRLRKIWNQSKCKLNLSKSLFSIIKHHAKLFLYLFLYPSLRNSVSYNIKLSIKSYWPITMNFYTHYIHSLASVLKN